MASDSSKKVELGDASTVMRKRKFSELLGIDFIRIEVCTGEHRKSFAVHKQLLSEKAPFFDKMFNEGFEEAQTNTAHLPEDKPHAFEAIVEWLYRGTILDVTVDNRHELLGLSYFASKYLLEELADRSLTKLIGFERSNDLAQSLQNIAYYCLLMAEASKLRLYLVRTASWVILNIGDAGIKNGDWSTVEICSLFVQDPVLMHDALKGLRASTKPGR